MTRAGLFRSLWLLHKTCNCVYDTLCPAHALCKGLRGLRNRLHGLLAGVYMVLQGMYETRRKHNGVYSPLHSLKYMLSMLNSML